MAKQLDKVYHFEENLKDTCLTAYAKYKPFRAREAFLMSKRLGRPLTSEEEAQFHYSDPVTMAQ